MQLLAVVAFSIHVLFLSSASCYELYLSSATEELVAGSYVSEDGGEVSFIVTSTGFRIRDQYMNIIISVDSLGKNHRIIEIKGNYFVQERNEKVTNDYYVTPATFRRIETAYNAFDFAEVNEIISLLKGLNRDIVNRKFQHSMTALLADPCSDLLVSAAIVMGENGLTGVDYPLLLPFYATSMTLAKLIDKRSVVQASVNPSQTTTSHRKRQSCDTTTCPPCQSNDCLGLCGLGCHCWKWVCQDCCFHEGCYEHDLCCAKSYLSLGCLLPWGFSCNSYTCN